MAKKRKAGGAPKTPQKSEEQPNKRVRMNVQSYEDVAGSDDEFHINRDKVLLDEGDDARRKRKRQEQEEFLEPSDEEVMAYSDESEDDENEVFMTPAPHRRAATPDDEDEADVDAQDEDGMEPWGTTKRDYYGADDMETEQDALDEEAEARRIQQKQLQGMTAADYGFDEDEWQDVKGKKTRAKEDAKRVVTEILPQLQISKDTTSAQRLKMLKSRYPEFEPLSKDFLDLQEEVKRLGTEASELEEMMKARASNDTRTPTPSAITKYRAASTYLAVLSMYFALLTSTAKNAQPDGIAPSANTLRDHPVMDSLLKCREMWLKAQSLPEESLIEDDAVEDLVDEEIDELDNEDEELAMPMPKKHKARKTRAQKTASAAKAEAEARRAERIRRTEADLANLDALVAQQPLRTKKSKISQVVQDQDDSDFGEETELTAAEAAEKARKKKSLRFYTSQIAQKANKRGAAGRNAGGDDDVPYRERLKDRQARLMAEAEKRGKKPVGAGEELGGSSDDEDRRQARDVRGETGTTNNNADASDDDDGYYDMVASRTALKKTEKRALAEAQKRAAEQGGQVVPQETVGADGKRKISYAIEKNKGLTPHRKKDVRNPRVKKRRKYEEKKKKLGSMKAVYKGGEGRGGYGGELTGIKTGLVKSTKL